MSKDLIQTIFSRRSIRKYADRPVSEVDIQTLLEAAMAAPSASNQKPWHFIVVDEREALEQLGEAHPYAKMLFEAPLCIAVCGDASISKHYWPQDFEPKKQGNPQGATVHDLDDVRVFEKAKAAKNGEKFSRLWSGDSSGYPSPSEADLALCQALCFWVGPDETRIDSLFRMA